MTKIKRKAIVDTNLCVACGSCIKACPLNIINIERGAFAKIDTAKCAKSCPSSVIDVKIMEVE